MNKYIVIIVAILLFAGQASAQEIQIPAPVIEPIAPVKNPLGTDIQEMNDVLRKDILRQADEMRREVQGANEILRKDALRQAEEMRKDLKESVNETTRETIKAAQEDVREAVKNAKIDTASGIATTTKEMMRATFEQQREQVKIQMDELRKEMQVRREEFKKVMEVNREETKKKIEENRAQLQVKLQNIKDEKKKTAVQTIDKRLEEINASRMDHFSNTLNQMEKVLENVKSRATKGEVAGKDITPVKADIVAAEAAIAAARTTIVAQSAKTYALVIGQEGTLRTDVGKTRQLLATDLKAVQDKVFAAREAIRKAATDLAKIPGINTVDVAPTATTTGTSTNQ